MARNGPYSPPAHHVDRRPVVRVVLQAIGDHQQALGLGAGAHHAFGVGDAGRHRLLAQHVLAGLRRAHGVFGMHVVRQHDVDEVDRRIVADAVEAGVVVKSLRRHAVLVGDGTRLGRVAADERRDAHMLARQRPGQDLVDRQMSETDHRDAQLAVERVEVAGRRFHLAVGMQLRQLDPVPRGMTAQFIGLIGLRRGAECQRRAGNRGAERRPPAQLRH